MYEQLEYGQALKSIVTKIEDNIRPMFQRIDEIAEQNEARVLDAFRKHRVSDFHLGPSTGYGYDDLGRDTLDAIYADVFGAEAGLVRPQLMSGTHAIATALYGVLRPGDELIYMTGQPYDTLEEIIGIRGEGNGSLQDFNILHQVIPLTDEGAIDEARVKEAISSKTKMIGIQRSRGYGDRPSFTVDEIEHMIGLVKSIDPSIIVFVDNCYGEFVESKEPTHIGADLMAGSLIKNPGGGLARTGGYIVGRSDLVELCSYRYATPGTGAEVGPSLHSLPEMYQGFYLAPHVVSQALKGAVFTSAFLQAFALTTDPSWDAYRTDLVQSVTFYNKESMVLFCQAIQHASPVNAHVTPVPSYMPGYEDDVIMAAGTFVQGSSIELSADGPIREPYIAYVQGGLTYSHVKIGIIRAIDRLLSHQLVQVPE